MIPLLKALFTIARIINPKISQKSHDDFNTVLDTIGTILPEDKPKTKKKKVVQPMDKYIKAAKRAAMIVGLPWQWLYAQMCHETATAIDGMMAPFTSQLCIEHFNCAGLTQNEPNLLLQPDGTCYYSSFSSLNHFADVYGKYLSRYTGIENCTSIDEFAYCLKNQPDNMNYYGDSYENYLAGLKKWLATIQ